MKICQGDLNYYKNMEMCDTRHPVICYEDDDCPLCESILMAKNRELEINKLETMNSDLIKQIDKLEGND
jgi:hypothetical protein